MALLALLLLAGCNEGGIVGTGDGGTDIGLDSSAPGVGSPPDAEVIHINQRLPITTSPALPPLLAGKQLLLQRQIDKLLLLQSRPQLEMLYLDAAFDAIARVCADTPAGTTCRTDGNTLMLTYTPALIRAENRLLHGTNSIQDEAAIAAKVGTPLPLDRIEWTPLADRPFDLRLVSRRLDNDGSAIRFTLEQTSDKQQIRLQYRADDAAGERTTLQQFTDYHRLTSRLVTESSTATSVLLLTTDQASDNADSTTLFQADYRQADASGYRHTGWAGQAGKDGLYYRARLSTTRSIGDRTTVERLLLGADGIVEARAHCQDSPAADQCHDDAAQWHPDVASVTTIQRSPLFLPEATLRNNASNRLGPVLNPGAVDSGIETLLAIQVTNEAVCASTRQIAGQFRHYCWQPAAPDGLLELRTEVINPDGLVLQPLSKP